MRIRSTHERGKDDYRNGLFWRDPKAQWFEHHRRGDPDLGEQPRQVASILAHTENAWRDDHTRFAEIAFP